MKQNLWHEIPGFRCDAKKLREHVDKIKVYSPTKTRSAEGEIYGWPITSKKGSSTYGIKEIALEENVWKTDLVFPTKYCFGTISDLIVQLALYGFTLSRARIVALSPGTKMKFHTDELSGGALQAWRLHVPILTNKDSKIQWQIKDQILEKHFPASGSAFILNVGESHRAVNSSKTEIRYHFIASIIRCNKTYKFWNNPYLY